MVAHVPHIITFIDNITRTPEVSEDNLRTALGLVGYVPRTHTKTALSYIECYLFCPLTCNHSDLCDAFGKQLATVLPHSFTERLIAMGL